MTDVSYWDNRRGKIVSSAGGWLGGLDAYSHGHSIMNELLGHVSYMQMIILNATGKLVDENLSKWFEGNFIG